MQLGTFSCFVVVILWGKYLNRGLAYNSNHPGSCNPFIINQEAHFMGILIYGIWMSTVSRIPRKEKLQRLQSIFQSRTKLQFQVSAKYISCLLFSYILHNMFGTELKLKTNWNKILQGQVWFLWSYCLFF